MPEEELKWQDVLGADIEVGDYIAYATMSGSMQIGRVLELRKNKSSAGKYVGGKWTTYEVDVPTLKIIGARSDWSSAGVKKMSRTSVLSKLSNVIVIKGNLPASLILL